MKLNSKSQADNHSTTELQKPIETTSSPTCTKPHVSSRFSIIKTILSDFALFAIVDNDLNKVICHLVYDNGEAYCEEMANKMLAGLNGC